MQPYLPRLSASPPLSHLIVLLHTVALHQMAREMPSAKS